MTSKKLHLTNLCLTVLIIVVQLAAGIYYIFYATPYYYLLAFLTLLLLFVPKLLRLITRKPVSDELDFMIIAFIFLASTVGLVLKGYSLIPYYDKLVHMLSGTVITLFGLCFYYMLNKDKTIRKEDAAVLIVFALAVSIAVAGLWEIGEYLVSILFHTDPQNVRTTGVSDTMLDMIVCTAGSLFIIPFVLRYFKTNRKNLVMSVVLQYGHPPENAPDNGVNEIVA